VDPIRLVFLSYLLTMSSADYCAYYDSQMGGAQLRVFRGGIQSGAGLGDVLRGVLRFLVPIALRGLGSFAGRTLLGTQAGKTLGEAAKAAVGPSLGVMAGHVAPAMSRFMNAYVPGVVPSQPPQPQEVDKQPDKQRGGGTLFDGIEGIPTTASTIKQYKKAAAPTRRAKRKSAGTVRFNY
jgi:hypothetical protein